MERVRSLRWLFPLAVLLPILLVAVSGYDGMEFNGDAYRYYESATNLVNGWHSGGAIVTGFWPLGYPLIAALFMMIAGIGFPAAQAVSFATAFLVLLFIGKLHRKEYSVVAPELFAGSALLAVSGYWLRYSTTIMSDMAAVCWSLGAIYFIRRWSDAYAWRFLVVTAFFAAFSIATRYVSGLVLLPLSYCVIRYSTTARLRAIRLFGLYGCVLLFFLPQLPFSLRMPEASVQHPWLSQWSFLNFLASDRTTIDGHLQVSWPNLLYYTLAPFRWSELTPVGGLFALVGCWHRFRHGFSRADAMMGIWYAGVWLFLCGIPIQNPRFALPMYVPIAWMMIAGLMALRPWLTRKAGIAVIPIYIGIAGWLGMHKWAGFVGEKDRMLSEARYFDQRIPPQARILSWDYFEAFHIYFPARKVSTIHGLDRQQLQELLDREGELYLLFDEARLTRAWAGLEPALAYQDLLLRNPSELLERQGRYSLRRCTATGRSGAPNSVPSPD